MPSSVKNTGDLYPGLEFPCGAEDNIKFKEIIKTNITKEYNRIPFPETAGIGLRPISTEGTEHLVRVAINRALKFDRKSVALVHKGDVMKYTEGAFKELGYSLA